MSPLEAARAAVPAWVLWFPLAFPLLAGLAAFALAWLLSHRSLEAALRVPEASWTERARLAYPGRLTAGRVGLLAAIFLSVAAWMGNGQLAYGPPVARFLLTFVLPYLAGAAVAHGLERRLLPGVTARGQWATLALQVLGLLPHLFLALLLAPLLPDHLDARTAPLFVSLWLGLGFLCLGGGLQLSRVLGLVRPAPPRLLAAVERAAQKVGHRPRRVLEARMHHANAMALVAFQAVLVTSRALALLDDEELASVCAHELGHLSEPRAVFLVRMLAIYPFIVALASMKLLFGALGLLGVYGALLAALVLVLGGRRLIRRMEVRADRASHEDKPEPAYARALEKLYQANCMPAVMPSSAIHPSLYDRMQAAGVTPGYARPLPPTQGRAALALTFVLFGSGLMGLSLNARAALSGRDEGTVLTAVALTGGSTSALAGLARVYREKQDFDRAGRIARAALALEPEARLTRPARAELLADADRCAEARLRLGGLSEPEDLDADDPWLEAVEAIGRCLERQAALSRESPAPP